MLKDRSFYVEMWICGKNTFEHNFCADICFASVIHEEWDMSVGAKQKTGLLLSCFFVVPRAGVEPAQG